MKANTNISLKSRGRLSLSDFRGVDLSAPQTKVSPFRATECFNMIIKDGINHKRNGWRRVLCMVDGARVNGMFSYTEHTNSGAVEILLVHAGRVLYRLCKQETRGFDCTVIYEDLLDERSQCYYRDNKAYIVGAGQIVVYGVHQNETDFRAVPIGEIAYVPTTTIAILPNTDHLNGGVGDVAAAATRSSLDMVNLLTPWRKNECQAPDLREIVKENEGVTSRGTFFALDGCVKEGTTATVEITTTTGNVYSLHVSLNDSAEESGFKVSLEKRANGLCMLIVSSTYYNSFDVIVTYSAEGVASDLIADCRFGTCFGVAGVTNRLFLAGNVRHKNRDWWSEQDDFTYFPDGNTMEVGSADSSVTGYARLSDSTLAVFKENTAGEATIHYRTGMTTTVTDEMGDTHEEAIFPCVAGTAGFSPMTPHGTANLAGDVLVLGRDGVFGIELSANIASAERYAKERSFTVFPSLAERDLTDAVLYTHGGRVYLAPCDGSDLLYVADHRYTATFENGSVGYEFYIWDNIPARVFASFGDEFLFGDAKGCLYRFEQGFADCIDTAFAAGELLPNGEGFFVYAKDKKIAQGDKVIFSDDVFVHLFDVTDVTSDGNGVRIPNDEAVYLRLFEGMPVRVEFASRYVTAYLCDLDVGRLTCTLRDESKDPVNAAGALRLAYNVKGEECTVVALDVDACTFGIAQGNTTLIVTDAALGVTGTLTAYRPVVATWLTPMFDCGTFMDRKTLLGLSIATEPLCGLVELGFETRRQDGTFATQASPMLDFNKIDFNHFTFLPPFATSMTTRLNVRNFNYIRFYIRSSIDEDLSVRGITALYKINQTNRGNF